MSVSFSYRPPAGAGEPVFMVLSFFGGCFGIRSMSGGDGQVNFWQGDPEEYWDSFFVPELGESKPRKGRVQAFGFQRGEVYNIEIRWTPGRELLLRIDGRDLYRAKAFKPDRGGFEVKTLRRAEIDDLALEGTLR
jgi:hypothetical protein